ncbi:ATP-binding protein [Albimonas pacifica]|uniref:histidine kinase n=1 Tax=Albimonas pacifica TaxID=1114924 RepID=A0A1I3JMI0_9RHOB|nr:ATP-binding protein [Albimonas pacifica]SFI61374.1 PAS domain S-box-containing protein [Albimonas pacifica]
MRLVARSEPRLAVIVMAAVSLSVVFATLLVSAGLQARLRDQALERSEAELGFRARLLANRVTGYVRLADGLSRVPPLAGLERAAATGFDAQEGSTRAQWAARLAAIFQSTLRAEDVVYQARYLDAAGREVVRLDRIDAVLAQTPEDRLQDKSGREYMRFAFARGAAPAFVTPIGMNRERGVLDPRLIPTLRTVAPALDGDGRVLGWIVLNIDLRETLRDMGGVGRFAGAPRIVDGQGRYAATLDPERIPAMAEERPGAAWDDHPALAARAAAGDAFPFDHAQPEADRLLVAAPLRFERMVPPADYMLVWERPASPVDALLAAAWTDALLAGLAATAAAGGLALLLGRRMARPLRRLAAAGEAVTRGADPDAVAWPAEGVHEIRRTAAAFHEMAIRARDRQEELRAREARLEAVMDGASNGIVSIDAGGRIRYVNRALLEMFGHRREALVGRDVSVLAPEPHASAHAGYLRAYARTGQARILGRALEVEAVRADGSRFPVRLAVSAHRVDGAPTYTGLIADLSEERRTERMKAEFISTVSHELRTPLASIKGALSLLRSGVAGELPAAADEMLDMAQSNGERLIRLINDILDFEKISAGGLSCDIARVDLRALAARSLAELASMAEARGVRLSLVPPDPAGPGEVAAEVQADAGRIAQVLANLVSNAVKHSDAGDAVVVAVTPDGDGWRVTVTDEGPGVPVHFRDRIFSRFAQADASDRRARGGTGLGLSISRAIVEAHGGEIGFDCPPGGGSVFAFRLPAVQPRTGEAWRAPPALVFARDPARREALAGVVAGMGLVPRPVEDVEAALLALVDGAPSAVVMDGEASCADCRRIVEALRRVDPGGSAPAILLVPALALGEDPGRAPPPARPVEVLEWPAGELDPERLRRTLAGRLGAGARVLLCEDDDDQARLLTRALAGLATVARAPSCAAARAMLDAADWDAVILDLRLPDGRGESLMGAIRSPRATGPLVLVYSVEEARGALREAVDAAFVKSAIEPTALAEALSALLARRAASGEARDPDPGDRELADADDRT